MSSFVTDPWEWSLTRLQLMGVDVRSQEATLPKVMRAYARTLPVSEVYISEWVEMLVAHKEVPPATTDVKVFSQWLYEANSRVRLRKALAVSTVPLRPRGSFGLTCFRLWHHCRSGLRGFFGYFK